MRKLWILLGCATLTGACNIEVNEPDDEWEEDDWEDEEVDAADVCDPYCLELIECGAISERAFVSCRDICVADFLEDEEGVTEGCSCVMDAACDSESANECEGAPLPGVFPEEENDGVSGGEGGMSGGEEPIYPSCTVDHDCKLGEDCIDGLCETRCVASCQCDEGMACVDGYCAEPADPPVVCESDCDCTSGESCLDGICK